MTAIFEIQDKSGDKKYFSQLPNYILNHSAGIDQALYWQMKRFAGEDGECFASEKTLMKKLGIGRDKFKKSLSYLLRKKWIKYEGMRTIQTEGGKQHVKSYSIVDIWKENIQFYENEQGVSKSTHPRDVQKRRGAENNLRGVSIQPIKNNQKNKEEPFQAKKPNQLFAKGKFFIFEHKRDAEGNLAIPMIDERTGDLKDIMVKKYHSSVEEFNKMLDKFYSNRLSKINKTWEKKKNSKTDRSALIRMLQNKEIGVQGVDKITKQLIHEKYEREHSKHPHQFAITVNSCCEIENKYSKIETYQYKLKEHADYKKIMSERTWREKQGIM